MSGIEARRAQAIKDYKLTVEYKHLKQNSPGGIYVVPSFADLRTWHGVIFVRRGMYASGVFKFRVELPPEYNDVGAARVFFTSRIYSPSSTRRAASSTSSDRARRRRARRPDRSLRFVDRDDGALDAFRGVLAGDDDDVDGPGTEAILRYLTDEAAREAAG
ncbi:hypothetical protein JL720_7809 [Aureococcus anophagefferens]|nr:hypothetical protein JL720_7809 [Aureococcus anophagefferens]